MNALAAPLEEPSGELASRPKRTDAGLDETAFERLFHECAGDVHAYVISLLGDAAAAEDVTALAFERVYRSRSRLNRKRGTPRAWLFAIARNAALDELRRRRRHPEQMLSSDALDPEHESDAPDGDPAGGLELLERRAVVRDALRSLSLSDLEIVLLKFHGQLSNDELARALGVSPSNAGTRLHRALTRLRARCVELDREGVA
jgi:RNA polymerase sigma-70 factor, ECF subfamily